MKDINFQKEKVLILDPTSPETNRGSFCYLSYLIYSHTLQLEDDEDGWCELYEEFRVSDMDRISHIFDAMDHILIALWSYPQIEICLMLNRMFKGKCRFFGYYPLIERLGLSPAYYTEEIILKGMRNYPNAYGYFEHLLLSDCDMHLKQDDGSTPKVYPLFTSYGCPKGCAFCPATKNQGKRLTLDEYSVYQMLEECNDKGITNIHFTDEDFFFDAARVFRILRHAFHTNINFRFIALGSVSSVYNFMVYAKGRPEWERDSVYHVLHLVEIGLETGSAEHLKDLGKTISYPKAVMLAIKFPVKILWLTMTFAPGETITSIAKTGEFLRNYGLDPKNMEERLVTNGTEGGLGQFFQQYVGAVDMEVSDGVLLTPRPMRLLPSFIPNSFLDCNFEIDMEAFDLRKEDLYYWMDVYGLQGKVVNWLDLRSGNQAVWEYTDHNENAAIVIALMARLGIIREVAE